MPVLKTTSPETETAAPKLLAWIGSDPSARYKRASSPYNINKSDVRESRDCTRWKSDHGYLVTVRCPHPVRPPRMMGRSRASLPKDSYLAIQALQGFRRHGIECDLYLVYTRRLLVFFRRLEQVVNHTRGCALPAWLSSNDGNRGNWTIGCSRKCQPFARCVPLARNPCAAAYTDRPRHEVSSSESRTSELQMHLREHPWSPVLLCYS